MSDFVDLGSSIIIVITDTTICYPIEFTRACDVLSVDGMLLHGTKRKDQPAVCQRPPDKVSSQSAVSSAL